VSRYQFIAAHRRTYPVQRLCAVLGIAASGFYDWVRREPSQRQQANEALAVRIREIHETSHQTYGYPRIHAELREAGEVVGQTPGCAFNDPDGLENARSTPLAGYNPGQPTP
jgi:hypothetical protein